MPRTQPNSFMVQQNPLQSYENEQISLEVGLTGPDSILKTLFHVLVCYTVLVQITSNKSPVHQLIHSVLASLLRTRLF